MKDKETTLEEVTEHPGRRYIVTRNPKTIKTEDSAGKQEGNQRKISSAPRERIEEIEGPLQRKRGKTKKAIVEYISKTWKTPFQSPIDGDKLLENPIEAGITLRKTLGMLNPGKTTLTLEEIYESYHGQHADQYTSVREILKAGYYQSTMVKDAFRGTKEATSTRCRKKLGLEHRSKEQVVGVTMKKTERRWRTPENKNRQQAWGNPYKLNINDQTNITPLSTLRQNWEQPTTRSPHVQNKL